MYSSNQFANTFLTKRSLIWNLRTKSTKIFLLQRVSKVGKCSDFLTFLKFRKKMRRLLKNVSDRKEMSESINTESETPVEHAAVEDFLNMNSTASNETNFSLRFIM